MESTHRSEVSCIRKETHYLPEGNVLAICRPTEATWHCYNSWSSQRIRNSRE